MNTRRNIATEDVRIVEDAGEGEADAELWALAANDTVLAHCSLWWRGTAAIGGERAGMIGKYSSKDARAGERMIDGACAKLATRGCRIAVGPVDGNTWNAYRFVTERGTEPSFYLEPKNDDDWPHQFIRCGFVEFSRYRSALQTKLAPDARRLTDVARRMAAANIAIRSIDAVHLDAELARLHPLVMAGFAHQPLFTPISVDDFVARHRALGSLLRQDFVLVAEQRCEPVALLLAIPDWAQQSRGETVDTVIVKTVVARPGRRYAGVAHVLLARSTAIAREAGFRRWIHALMRESGHSANWSARCGTTMRRYALFARALGR